MISDAGAISLDATIYLKYGNIISVNIVKNVISSVVNRIHEQSVLQ